MALPEGSYAQTAYVVRNVEQAAAAWTKATGAGPWFVFEVESKNLLYRGRPSSAQYRLAMCFLGATNIELISPVDDEPSILKEVLDERGEGYHHVSPRLSGLSGPTFDAACRDLETRGYEVAMTNEVVGLGRAAYYDAKATTGGFVEVFEMGSAYPMTSVMADLHLEWDGVDPIRPFSDMFATVGGPA